MGTEMDTSPHRAWRGFAESDLRKIDRGPLTIPAMISVGSLCDVDSYCSDMAPQEKQKVTFV